jgi:hypothetical protein
VAIRGENRDPIVAVANCYIYRDQITVMAWMTARLSQPLWLVTRLV